MGKTNKHIATAGYDFLFLGHYQFLFEGFYMIYVHSWNVVHAGKGQQVTTHCKCKQALVITEIIKQFQLCWTLMLTAHRIWNIS